MKGRRGFLGLVILSVLAVCPGEVRSDDGTGLQTSVAVDMVGSFGSSTGADGATGRLDIREAEFMFYAPIDPVFDGVLGFAAHYEQGTLFAEAHGAYIETTKLIPRSRIRLGQFFLGFGRINRIHRHDWPFTSTPKVQREFFDLEGVLDTGLEYGYLLPLPFYLDLTVGVTNGWNFGHSHTEGARPAVPTHYARLATYFDLPGQGGLESGFNYVGRKTAGGTTTSFFGLDLVAKWREANYVSFLLQSEVWLRRQATGTGSTHSLGLYVFPRYYLGRQWYLGTRFDYYSVLDLKDAFGAELGNYYLAVEPMLSWVPSEFSQIRFSYAYRGQNQGGTFISGDHVAQLQAVFIIGAHPAHEF